LALPLCGQAETQFSVGTAPLNLVSGRSLTIEYRYTPEISIGLDSAGWRTNFTGSEFHISGIKPFARYYADSNGNAWFGGAGLAAFKWDYTTTTWEYSAYRNFSIRYFICIPLI